MFQRIQETGGAEPLRLSFTRVTKSTSKERSMRHVLLLTVLLVAAACGPSAEYKRYREFHDTAASQAMSGAISWSNYYQGCYDRAAQMPSSGWRTLYMAGAAANLQAALALERGEITQLQFADRTRSNDTMVAAGEARLEAQRQAGIDRALDNLQAVGLGIAQAGAPANTYAPTHCTTSYLGTVATTNCY
jgi:hypothetical protein